jgi:uncharacterized protein (TIGR02444 family)
MPASNRPKFVGILEFTYHFRLDCDRGAAAVHTPLSELASDAIALYGSGTVAPACLLLQDEAGLDVNVLLFAAWMGARRRVALGESGVRRAAAYVADWHREVVLPLRVVRRKLKTGPAPAPTARTNSLRTELKAAELSAELIELDRLHGLTLEPYPAAPEPDAAEAALQNMLHAVELYAGRAANPREREAVERITARAAEMFAER